MFLLIPFFKYLKKYTYESENTWNSVFIHTLFQIVIKGSLRILKYLGHFFSLIQFLKYLEKHTDKSQKYQGGFFYLNPFSKI